MDIKELSVEERALLCSGKGKWYTQEVKGLKSIMMTDGPHGLRKVLNDGDPDKLERVRATCFPSAAGLACSWNEELIGEVGAALAGEAKAEQVSVILGPGVNIKRSPLCGRNFEYFSEDPFLAGRLAAAYVNGVQSKGVGTSLKHFAVNSQETKRFTIDEIVSQRALREIYLTAFEMTVKNAQPKTIMASYNMLNGEHTCQSKTLLTDILRKEWGFKGLVMSDWHAVADGVAMVDAGCDLEMPSSNGQWAKRIAKAVEDGLLDEEKLNASAGRVAELAQWGLDNIDDSAVCDAKANHSVAAHIAQECMVLLKNDDGVLPFEKGKPTAVIGGFAKNPRYQGGGSSHVEPTFVDDITDYFEKIGGGELVYAPGYPDDTDMPDEKLIAEAVAAAKKCGRAVIFSGMPESYEREGHDRKHMMMPPSHIKLIEAVGKACENTVVVLSAGSPVEMPWLRSVKGLLHAYLGGQALGSAIAQIIYGDVNPSGKLAETHPVRLEDTPSYGFFPGDGFKSVHAEDIYVGYRWYDKRKIKVNFPFGYGLSYTKYEYSDITLDKKAMTDEDTLFVTVRVANTGDRDGKETVELYVSAPANSVEQRPVKELKGFKKLYLKAGESKEVTFELDKRAFAFWDERFDMWRVPSGVYTVFVGGSSDKLPLNAQIEIEEKNQPFMPLTKETTFDELMTNKAYAKIANEVLLEVTNTDFANSMIGYAHGDPVNEYKGDANIRKYFYYRPDELTLDMMDDIVKRANEKLAD